MTNQNNKIKIMTIAALLGALGYLIPTIMPLKIKIEPASFTFASHVPVMIAMFISPAVAIFVALVTTLAFIPMGPVIALRALTHIIFASLGAYYLKKNNKVLKSIVPTVLFAFAISVIHALAEVTVSSIYFTGTTAKSFVTFVLGLVGIGTIIHSMADFTMAIILWIPLQYVVGISVNANVKTAKASRSLEK